jgi:hypothetical protein
LPAQGGRQRLAEHLLATGNPLNQLDGLTSLDVDGGQ